MTAAALLLARRALGTRPRRTFVLLLGYGLGVGVMVALLAVGDALLLQAQDRDLVAGGDLVLLPEGVDPELLKVGGVTAMYLAIPNARYLARQVLLGPRYADDVAAVSPEVTDRLVYVRPVEPAEGNGPPEGLPARASAALPEAARAARSALAVPGPAWRDTAADRAWLRPDPATLLATIDRFHRPTPGPAGRTWAEWWYFNLIDRSGTYGYLAFVAARDGRVQVGLSLRLPDGRHVRWEEVHTDTVLPVAPAGRADALAFRAGPHRIDLQDGIYRIRLRRAEASLDLTVRPVPGLVFPPVEWSGTGGFRSGYVVPALRAAAHGALRLGARTVPLAGVAYHDHNWGVWEAVTWEWGTASTATFALLAGQLHHPAVRGQEMFLALYAGGPRPGLLATLRATPPVFGAWRMVRTVDGRPVRVPGRMTYRAANDAGDRLAVTVAVRDVVATPAAPEGAPARLVFLQVRGVYTVEGRVRGQVVRFQAEGFAETFRPLR
ncbi:MAG: hypothetical protein QN122_13260 [Armatimonadota bacterium]|nr:hypothetical protein [Armatimonadota bacterium]MDR7450133.1 hypothetical protein [Armatimonadota bacterium]MDR7460617.1 hypothetical protein [Armatimonadota bacterium]MDR7480844.1 hypothetical protein [Armatimonadota bacterium]MDR7489513.1 hypothetical protein [Armatimonadota bacterium]